MSIGPKNLSQKHDNMRELAQNLNALYMEVLDRAQEAQNKFAIENQENKCSLDNLLCYLALREFDLTDLQLNLADKGLSSLGRLECHVISSIEKVISNLGMSPLSSDSLCRPSFSDARITLNNRSQLLLGRPRQGRSTRIMVTLDSTNIHQPELIEQLLISGMDIARINCAHDSKKEWKMLIDAIRNAEERLVQRGQGIGRRCRIVMDLAGPKIRTGPLETEVRPLKISVPKNELGQPLRYVEGFLDSEARQSEKVVRLTGVPPGFLISILSPQSTEKGLGNLKLGEKLRFKDIRGRLRTMIVLEKISETRLRVGLDKTAYLSEGLDLHGETSDISFTIGPIKPQSINLQVKAGDLLRLYRPGTILGHRATEDGEPAGITCTSAEVLDQVQVGQGVHIDDGKISAIVVGKSATESSLRVPPSSPNDNYLILKITSPTAGSSRIRPEKGLNFPDSALKLSALTSEDIRSLDFVTRFATAVALSFVHSPQDLYDLRGALEKLGRSDIGIIAKIETADAIHSLAQIVIAGLRLPKFGLLIARGDLAVEVGFENLALVQEDILCLSEAAHIPVVLATQVLERLAKSGLATRAEIMDAAMGQRAECVMLNKGEHILEAVKTLSELLSMEERHHVKKRHVFREFTKQQGIFDL